MSVTVKMGRQGRVVVPAALRRELRLAEGDEVDMTVQEGHLTLKRRLTQDEAARNLRGILRLNHSVVDELIAERRAEAERE